LNSQGFFSNFVNRMNCKVKNIVKSRKIMEL
jgi:hypothetical protein